MTNVSFAMSERTGSSSLSDADRMVLHEMVDAIATEPSDDNISRMLILLSTVMRTRPKRYRR